ncbi:MAG: protein kinase [Gemmatimonadetes bacterium]|nr:protein kinase [Gemmatimonadota bacterium]
MDATLRSRLEAALGTTCTIEREDARERSFVARDASTGRQVLIRVLPDDVAEGLDLEVFLRAIEPLARLDEAHVVSVLGGGQSADGLVYYVMPFVDGETLRHHLEPGPLPIDVVVKILHDVAAALEYAHAHGVDHRAIDVDSLWLTADVATVIDFGVAKAIAAARGVEVEGADVGADLFAWGVLADELLSGAHAFTGRLTSGRHVETQFAVLPTQRVAATERDAPAALNALVLQSLAKDPQSRPQTAAELVKALEAAWWTANLVPATKPKKSMRGRWIAAGVTAGVGLMAFLAAYLGGAFAPQDNTSADENPEIRIGMLPLYNEGAPDEEFLSDGISEEIRVRIANIPTVQMVGRASSLPYKGSTKPLATMAAELNVRYLIVGSVHADRSGSAATVRVQFALLDSRSGKAVWRTANRVPVSDLPQYENLLMTQVAGVLKIPLTPGQPSRLTARPTENAAAYEAFLRAESDSRALTATDQPTIRKAIANYTKAVALDPKFALAWARLARAHMIVLPFSVPSDADEARRASERAMELAPQRWESQWARGMYYDEVSREHKRALAAQLEATRLAPEMSEPWDGLALSQSYNGRWEEARVSVEHALLLDTRSMLSLQHAADIMMVLGQNDDASGKLILANSIDPMDPHIIFRLMLVRLAERNREGARAEMRESVALADDVNLLTGGRVIPWMLDPALQDRLLVMRSDAFVEGRGAWALTLAQIYSLRGNFVRARSYADSARASLEGTRRDAINGHRIDQELAQAYSILNRHDATIASGTRSLQDLSFSTDKIEGAWNQYLVARTYVAIGEREEALRLLDEVLAPGGFVQPAWARLDPAFASLSGNAHFERLSGRLP